MRRMSLLLLIGLMLSLASPASAQSTRDNPTPFGKTARINAAWQASVIGVDHDAYDALKAISEHVTAPAQGHLYVLIRFRITYTGSDVGSPDIDLIFRAVGKSSVSYDYRNYCPYVSYPEALPPTDVFPGGSFDYDRCFEVPKADAETLVAYVKIFLEDGLTFFSLDDPDANATPTSGA